MSFDDKQVQAYDLKNLEKDCFGGKFTVDAYDNFLKTNSPQEYDKPNSAYMLLYERARSEVFLDSPAPSANSCIKDEDGDALMKEIQQVESTEKNTYIEMPPSIHLCVWKENLKFVHEMHLLDKDYFRFLLKLVEANVDLIDSRAVKCQSGGKQGLVRRYILEALIEAKDEASRHPKSCLHFWELLGQLLFNIEDPEEYSLAQKQLDDELHWLETAPAAVDEEDKLMEGHLLLTRVLVEILDCRIIGSSKVPHGRRLVYKLISTFLFPESTFLWHDEETNGNSIPSGVQFGIIGTSPESDRVFQSKCATRASRDKAFQLLICLVTHCIESLHELVELLVKIHFTDDLKRFDFDYETMQRLKLKDRFEFPIHLDMKPFIEGFRESWRAQNLRFSTIILCELKAMESLISLVNRVQAVCTLLGDDGVDNTLPTLWLSLPSIVVVGGQSSGKSSVLESIVGRDFFPRGSGIITRRPLVLQLHKIDANQQEYAEFLHIPNKRFTDYAAVQKEIQGETDRVAGHMKRISPSPIHLSIFSPHVVNLTLIDLPGLTKVAVEGQPDTIVAEIENLVRTYIEKPNSLILAISPANQDIATSDAIRLAREVDPSGERTYGVLTKLDLMDRGTNAKDVLEGRAYRLQHPWVGVINRSQADINNNVDMIAARQKERDYFKTSPEYRHLAGKMGSEYLAKILSKHLEDVIKARIPTIYSLTNNTITELEAEMKRLGSPVTTDEGAQLYKILELCRTFDHIFKEHLDGRRPGGERIYAVFENQLPAALKKLPFDRHLSLQNVRKVVSEADGYQPHLIAPEQGYRRLIDGTLIYFKGPAEASVEAVHLILKELVRKSINETEDLKRFPRLKAKISAAATEALERFRDGVEEDRDSDIASVEPHVCLTVTISKGEGPFLEFICTGYTKEVLIDAMVFKHPQKKASDEGDRIPYDGPDFNDLGESLQKALRPRV